MEVQRFKNKRGENISKAKKENRKNKGIVALSDDSSFWKINCTNCGSEITFEKYNRFQNAKSAIKRGKSKCCQNCKDVKIKIKFTDNPDDWKIKCRSCENFIQYSSYGSWRTSLLKEQIPECKNCNLESRKLIIRKDRQYSRNPEDWKNKCGTPECENIIVYTTLKGYQGAMKRIKDGNPSCCYSCVSKRCEKIDGVFRPNFNKNTINFIDTELSEIYKTKFRHALHENGEFAIFDEELDCYYFADAYSEELKLWIEFDEAYKFGFGKLHDSHINRHNRILEISDVKIIRFKELNRNTNPTYKQYNIGETD